MYRERGTKGSLLAGVETPSEAMREIEAESTLTIQEYKRTLEGVRE